MSLERKIGEGRNGNRPRRSCFFFLEFRAFLSLLFLIVVVSVLTYLLTKEDLTPEEVNGHAIDVVAGGVDTVSVDKK